MKTQIAKLLRSLIALFIIVCPFQKTISQDDEKWLYKIINDTAEKTILFSQFENSKFDDYVNYSNSQFDSVARFNFTKFPSKVYFVNATFRLKATFMGTEFDSAVTFNSSEFISAANFSNVKFNNTVDFGNAQFHFISNFDRARFNANADFINANFYSTTNFQGAIFKYDATFLYTLFQSNVRFDFVEFHSNTDFLNAVFKANADFNSAKFYSTVRFWVILPDTLRFSNITFINKEIDFTLAKLDSAKLAQDKDYKCKIDLVNSDINKIKINYELFKLWFPANTSYEKKLSIYEKLLKKFKDDGFLESYKALDIEYQNFKNHHNGKKALNWFLKNWWNYGYNKEWVLLWSLYLYLFFSFLNIFLFKKLQRDVFEISYTFYDYADFQGKNKQINCSSLLKENQFVQFIINLVGKRWGYFMAYVINSMIYTAILFFGLKISYEKFKKFSGWGLYVWFIYLIGIFCLAYIFNIIIVK